MVMNFGRKLHTILTDSPSGAFRSALACPHWKGEKAMNPFGAEVDLRMLEGLFWLLAVITGIFVTLGLASVVALVAREWKGPRRTGIPACPSTREQCQVIPIRTMPIPDHPTVASIHRVATLVAR